MKRMIPVVCNIEQAFTLIELLVVIAIIGILAGLLLPALGKAKIGAQKKVAQTEEANLVAAINQYQAAYSRLPASSNAVVAASTDGGAGGNSNDFTFGTVIPSGATMAAAGGNPYPQIETIGETSFAYQNNNSEVIAILRDDPVWPEATNVGANFIQHIYNPQKTLFFNAKIGLDTNSPGIGPDDVFRDPWGSPYIITLDLNYDNKCFDATLNQMYTNNSPTPAGPLLVPGSAIVWSLGPSKTIQTTNALNTGFNHQTIVTSF